MKLNTGIWVRGLGGTVLTFVLVIILMFALKACYPPEITQTQIVQEANSILGNMTVYQQQQAYAYWEEMCVTSGHLGPDWTFDQFLVQAFGPQPPPRMP